MNKEQYKKERRDHYTNIINGLLLKELSDLKEVTADVEKILKADMIDVEVKAIRILEEIQKIRFNTVILRELQDMKNE